MAYPQELDQLTNPSASDNTVTVSHSANHTAANNSIEAIQTKLGVNNSAVNTTIDYKLTSGNSTNPGHKHTLAGALNDVVITNPTNGNGLFHNGTNWVNADTNVADSSTTVKGVVKLTEAPASATEPIAVGTNDSRFTTLSGGALHGTTNKIVDQAMVTEAKTASKIPIRDANSDILVATTPTAGDAATSKTYVNSFFTYTASDNLISSSDSEVATASSSQATPRKIKETKIWIPGVLRIKFSLRALSGGTSYGQIYKNGSAFGTERSTSDSGFTEYSEDLTFAAGDLVQLYFWGTQASANGAKEWRIYADSSVNPITTTTL